MSKSPRCSLSLCSALIKGVTNLKIQATANHTSITLVTSCTTHAIRYLCIFENCSIIKAIHLSTIAQGAAYETLIHEPTFACMPANDLSETETVVRFHCSSAWLAPSLGTLKRLLAPCQLGYLEGRDFFGEILL